MIVAVPETRLSFGLRVDKGHSTRPMIFSSLIPYVLIAKCILKSFCSFFLLTKELKEINST
jgi:hypothetical protein